MIAKLIVRTGPLAGKDYAVSDVVRLGAAQDAEIRVRIDGVSRSHARMFREGEAYILEDAGSTNGTFLNGQRIQRERVRHLDVITLGRNLDLIFLCAAGEMPPAPADTILAASLQWLDGRDSGLTVPIDQGELTIGRATSCNIVVESAAVSKVHARIVRSADQIVIQDLGSANGTFVNGKRVPSIALTNRDRVGLAGVRSFVMQIERDPRYASRAALESTPPGGVTGAVFDQEWKTRLVWSSEELAEIEAGRQKLREMPAALAAGAGAPSKAKPPAKAVASPAPLRAAGALPKPAASPAPEAPPPVPVRAKPSVPLAGGIGESAPPVPPRAAPPPTGDGAAVKPPPSVPERVMTARAGPESAAVSEPTPSRTPPAALAESPVAPQRAGAGASASDPAAPGAGVSVPRPDRALGAQPVLPHIDAPASAEAAAAASSPQGNDVPAPHTSQPPPERRTGPIAAQVRPVLPREGQPIQSVRLVGTLGTFTLEAGTYTVGRSEKAEIRVDDREVSRAHAIVIVSPTSVTVEDQKSANGTFVNDVEVKARQPLRNGDKVMFGSVEFAVETIHAGVS